MSKITKLMLVLVGGAMILSTVGCGGGGGDDDTIANVAGVWTVTMDGDSDLITITQNGHDLTLIDPDFETADGEIYGRSVTFEFTEVDSGVVVTLLIELTANSDDYPTLMTGTLSGIVDGQVIQTYAMTWVR
ncbi:MAG: hypothetical protein PF692_15855 [Kiritimatiellae bacterium]|jgi:hypothetical protein|nr:hypothetical protein [Kiritimatiellia bacterium]